MPDWRDSTATVVEDDVHPSGTITSKRNAMKGRDSSYGTFSEAGTHTREHSYASTSRATLESLEGEETALLKTGKHVEPQGPETSSKNFATIKSLNPSLRLENSGSVARDHLASERTFLSYVRTSLAISMAGVVFGQMFLLSTSYTQRDSDKLTGQRRVARPIAVCTILLGIFVLLTGATRYFLNQNTLLKGGFSPARRSIAIISMLLVTVTSFIFFVIITDASNSA